MKSNPLLRGIAALSLALILTGCGTDLFRLDKPAASLGQARATAHLPPYPGECRTKEAHASLVSGSDALSTLKRERAALNRQNGRTDNCAGFYDDLAKKLD